MLQMKISDISPSVNKAVAIESDYLEGATTGTGQLGPHSERYIRKSWEFWPQRNINCNMRMKVCEYGWRAGLLTVEATSAKM
jgi:hypothetical protein